MKLKDRIAVITGGGSGIGEATSKLFASEGAKIAVADIQYSEAEKVALYINEHGGEAIAVETNVVDQTSVKNLVDKTVARFSTIDILINNAGITRDSLSIKMKVEDWDAVINVNLKGTFLCCQAVIPIMSKKHSGKIINTASVVIRGNVGQANYVASKMGIIGLTRTLALEFAKRNININCIAPGATATPMMAAVPEKGQEFMLSEIPMGRFAIPEEIAKTHLFLASEDSNYITGQCIFVDGGMSIGL
ncbi:MAG: 3-oxoacyl-[acyl-carrier-protein] reductase [Candidatus Schekmanbacteria bacterium RBG_13_48_7]|uniref:3-oxoacyl-[acyl-carrier-protein] reductase n=1 Tax=Candidatus Schekmanbacteria bacterium RBG_13_48_7 TaxID=1817878 RepID=A0A1F7RRX0_9BACT|nr:MAG: 3-oxoacyl-[acyl-carrier-protein] reductase [Candidatus Schekmanbacteria bacterium RBG_13_48_7]